uniref:Uncharacterized protein n=1 Tax=Setaria italica TaxID=4555 RepID=K4A468_SETIT
MNIWTLIHTDNILTICTPTCMPRGTSRVTRVLAMEVGRRN